MPTKLPEKTTVVDGDSTIITEYRQGEDGKVQKVTRTIVKKLVKTTVTIKNRRVRRLLTRIFQSLEIVEDCLLGLMLIPLLLEKRCS
jgi:hypothetical protein